MSRVSLKPRSNELDFSQCNIQHFSSGKSRDSLTTLFAIHVETCCNMLYFHFYQSALFKTYAGINFIYNHPPRSPGDLHQKFAPGPGAFAS